MAPASLSPSEIKYLTRLPIKFSEPRQWHSRARRSQRASPEGFVDFLEAHAPREVGKFAFQQGFVVFSLENHAVRVPP
jgi:hypothetical protein